MDDAGATASHGDFYGNTALHFSLCAPLCALPGASTDADLAAMVPLWHRLIERGARLNAQNHEGDTPDDVLRKIGLPGIQEFMARMEAERLDAAMDTAAPSEPGPSVSVSSRKPRL